MTDYLIDLREKPAPKYTFTMGILNNPLWQFLFFIFLLHQFLEKVIGVEIWWADSYLDSLLCMPIFLGLILVERRYFLSLRKKKEKDNNIYTFSFFEIIIMIVTFAVIFEEGFPRWFNQFTRDYWDYFNYLVGGLFFHYYFNKKES